MIKLEKPFQFQTQGKIFDSFFYIKKTRASEPLGESRAARALILNS